MYFNYFETLSSNSKHLTRKLMTTAQKSIFAVEEIILQRN